MRRSLGKAAVAPSEVAVVAAEVVREAVEVSEEEEAAVAAVSAGEGAAAGIRIERYSPAHQTSLSDFLQIQDQLDFSNGPFEVFCYLRGRESFFRQKEDPLLVGNLRTRIPGE